MSIDATEEADTSYWKVAFMRLRKEHDALLNREAAKPKAEGDDMARGALDAIHELLDDGGIPRGTFADDQVRNLVALYNQRGDRISELEAALPQQAPVAEQSTASENIDRCEHCNWPIVPEGEAGCWKSNCSMRPMPPLRGATATAYPPAGMRFMTSSTAHPEPIIEQSVQPDESPYPSLKRAADNAAKQLKSLRAVTIGKQPDETSENPNFPMGAIENGRHFMYTLETCGHIHRVEEISEWHELKRCFEYMAQYLLETASPKREMSNPWQPIETIPKDGSWVRVGAGYINPKTGATHEELVLKYNVEDGHWINVNGGAHGLPSVWTHWSMLSPIPTRVEDGNGK